MGYTLFQPCRRSQSPEQDSNLRFLDYSRCSSAITFRAKRTGQGLNLHFDAPKARDLLSRPILSAVRMQPSRRICLSHPGYLADLLAVFPSKGPCGVHTRYSNVKRVILGGIRSSQHWAVARSTFELARSTAMTRPLRLATLVRVPTLPTQP